MTDEATISRLLAERDQKAGRCPVNKVNAKFYPSCPMCGAGPNQGCPVIAGADYAFVGAVREVLQASPAPGNQEHA